MSAVTAKMIFRNWLTRFEKPMVRKLFCSDLYISSANAVTLDGHILNIDGVGNRVATITIGPGKVVLVAGINKITRTLEEAHTRL